MALSGSTNYAESFTAANLIALALRRLGVLGIAETINSTEESNALVTLNLIVKEWSSQGADVWLRNTGHMFLESPGTVDGYTVGTSLSASFTSQYYTTTLNGAVASGGTTLVVDDDTNIADTDHILTELDDGTLDVTTVNGAPSANSVTLTAGLDSAAADGNIVYTFKTGDSITDKITKIVYAARRITNLDNVATNAGYMEGIDSQINIIGEDEYRLLPTKLQTGTPVSIHHRQEEVNPTIFIWPTGGTGRVHSIVLEYNTYLQDFDATSNNIDLPAEGANALVWSLAAEMASEYGLGEREQARLWSLSRLKTDEFFDYMVEDASIVFTLDEKGRY